LIYFDKDIIVKDENIQKPVVSSPIITKSVREIHRLTLLPYKLGNIEAVVNPNFNFGKKDKLYVVGSIDRGNYNKPVSASLKIENMFNKKKYSKEYNINIGNAKITYFKKYINTVPPGNYKVILKISSANSIILDKRISSFAVNLVDHSKTPGNIHKFTKSERLFDFYRIISYQYKNLGNFDKSFFYIKKAFELNKESPIIFKEYADLLLMKKDFKTILNIVEKFKDKNGAKFIYLSVKGRALYSKGGYNEAINILEEANNIYDSDINVLNTLGMSYLKMGAKERAKKVLEASLKINYKQKKIKKVLNGIK
jgi:tetratricopeptide (TPR) repeat protein